MTVFYYLSFWKLKGHNYSPDVSSMNTFRLTNLHFNLTKLTINKISQILLITEQTSLPWTGKPPCKQLLYEKEKWQPGHCSGFFCYLIFVEWYQNFNIFPITFCRERCTNYIKTITVGFCMVNNLYIHICFKRHLYITNHSLQRAASFFPLMNSTYNFNLYVRGTCW